MTDDRIEGLAREGVGRLQDAAGGLIGDEQVQTRGKFNQAAGALQHALGKTKDQVGDAVGAAGDYAEDALDELAARVRERPLTAIGLSVGLGLVIGLAFAGARRG